MLSRPPRRRGLRQAAALIGIVVLVGLAGGCGQTVQVGRIRILQLSVTEYHVAPQSVRAPAGTLSIFVHNYGRLSHNLVLTRAGERWASTQPIPPGQTTELIARLSPGRYLMSSTILSDQALGTYGTLTVK